MVQWLEAALSITRLLVQVVESFIFGLRLIQYP